MAAALLNDNPQKYETIEKLSTLPGVTTTIKSVSSLYTNIKDSNDTIKYGLDTLESGIQLAKEVTTPLAEQSGVKHQVLRLDKIAAEQMQRAENLFGRGGQEEERSTEMEISLTSDTSPEEVVGDVLPKEVVGDVSEVDSPKGVVGDVLPKRVEETLQKGVAGDTMAKENTSTNNIAILPPMPASEEVFTQGPMKVTNKPTFEVPKSSDPMISPDHALMFNRTMEAAKELSAYSSEKIGEFMQSSTGQKLNEKANEMYEGAAGYLKPHLEGNVAEGLQMEGNTVKGNGLDDKMPGSHEGFSISESLAKTQNFALNLHAKIADAPNHIPSMQEVQSVTMETTANSIEHAKTLIPSLSEVKDATYKAGENFKPLIPVVKTVAESTVTGVQSWIPDEVQETGKKTMEYVTPVAQSAAQTAYAYAPSKETVQDAVYTSVQTATPYVQQMASSVWGYFWGSSASTAGNADDTDENTADTVQNTGDATTESTTSTAEIGGVTSKALQELCEN